MLGTREGDDAFEVAFVESTKRPSYTLLVLRHRPLSIPRRGRDDAFSLEVVGRV
jgi:hypothetical protein